MYFFQYKNRKKFIFSVHFPNNKIYYWLYFNNHIYVHENGFIIKSLDPSGMFRSPMKMHKPLMYGFRLIFVNAR